MVRYHPKMYQVKSLNTFLKVLNIIFLILYLSQIQT